MDTELKKDIDSLKEDLSKFRDDISAVLSDAGHFSREKVQQTRERLGTAMNDFEGLAAEKINRANEIVCDGAKKAVDASREMVLKRPFTAAAVCFGAGILTAILLGRPNHHG